MEAPADAHPSRWLGAPELGRDLAVATTVDDPQPQRLALFLRQAVHRLGKRLAHAFEVDELLDPVVVVVVHGSLGHPQSPPGPGFDRTGSEVPRQQVLADPVQPPGPVDALVPEPAAGRERLRERLGHELRRDFGIERAPGEERGINFV